MDDLKSEGLLTNYKKNEVFFCDYSFLVKGII